METYTLIPVLVLLNILSCHATSNDFIIVNDLENSAGINGTIYTGPMDTLQLQPIPLQNVKMPAGITYDPVEQRIYWTDVTNLNIQTAFVNGTGQEVVVTLDPNSKSYGIAVDPVNRHIYWSDEGLKRIERVRFDGSSRQVVIEDNLDKPRGIIVDSAAGHLYWTDYGVDKKIERSTLDGTERVILVDGDLLFPFGIDLDFEDQKLYFCDAGTNKIESIDLDGSNRRTHFHITNPNIHPFDVASYKEHIYWSDWNLAQLYRVGKDITNAQLVGSVGFEKAGGLYIHRESDNSCLNNECANGSQCRQLSTGYQCACLPGFAGDLCEIDINECSSNPCMNQGMCIDGINSYSCDCPEGWTGDNCQIDVNECIERPSPCHSDADCYNNAGSYNCDCKTGFTGDGFTSCTAMDNCTPDPCQNAGVCSNRIDDFECACVNGFTGETCQIAPSDPCRYQPCRNGATCSSVGDQVVCSCVNGFIGDLCDMVPPTPVPACSNPGQLNHGYVISGDSNQATYPPGTRLGYVCDDDYDLEGSKELYCQIDSTWSHKMPVCVNEKGEVLPTYAVGGGAAGIGLIILILVVILIVVCCRKRNSGSNTLLERPRLETPSPKLGGERPFTPTPPSHYNTAFDHRSPDPLYNTRISLRPMEAQSIRLYEEIPGEMPTLPRPGALPRPYELHETFMGHNGLPLHPPAYDTLRKDQGNQMDPSDGCVEDDGVDGSCAANRKVSRDSNYMVPNVVLSVVLDKDDAIANNSGNGVLETIEDVDDTDIGNKGEGEDSDYVTMREGVKIDVRMPNDHSTR